MFPRVNAQPIRRAAVLVATASALGACVERKMIIRSDPPGALIALDGVDTELATPAEIPFDFGGTRGITLIAPGKKVVETTIKVQDPWYTYFPLDIGAEFLWPGTIQDVQTFDFKMDGYQPIDRAMMPELRKKLDEVKLRAAQYRAGGSEGPGTTPPPPPATTTPPAPAATPPKK